MLFERRRTDNNAPINEWEGQSTSHGDLDDAATSKRKQEGEPPLFCMIYFFASQMSRNLIYHQQSPGSSGIPSEAASPPQHKLDAMLSKLSTHAAFSPHVTRFEPIPVEIPPVPGQERMWKKRGQEPPSKESMHDTMLLMKFRNKRAREAWIATREWMEFMDATEREGVFRRIPHVRCARSLKGLRDPIEVLSA